MNTIGKSFAKGVGFMIITVFLVGLIAFFVSATVMSRTQGGTVLKETCYYELEQDYLRSVREYLAEQGYESCGINLTHVSDDQGNRAYEIMVNHRRLGRLSEAETAALLEQIENMGFQMDGCSFTAKAQNM